MERPQAGFSRPVVVGLGALFVLTYAGAVARLALRNSHFIGDDLVGFWMAMNLPFGSYLLTPLDIHLAPLHRLVSFAVRMQWPMNFEVGLAVLAVFHLSAVVLLYLTLERLRSTRYNWLFVGLYAMHVYLLDLFLWWTAGMHRLPCAAFSIAAVYAYVRFRDGGRRIWIVPIVLSEVLAFGFFIKALLIPVFLAGVEACFWRETPAGERKRNAAVVVLSAMTGVSCVLVWYFTATQPARALALDWRFQLTGQVGSWKVLLESTLGFAHAPGWRTAVAGAVWLAAIVFSVGKDRWRGIPWICLVVTVSASVLVTCLPFARLVFFHGSAVELVNRYYFELMLPFVLFAALAFRGLLRDEVGVRRLGPKVPQVVAATLLAPIRHSQS